MSDDEQTTMRLHSETLHRLKDAKATMWPEVHENVSHEAALKRLLSLFERSGEQAP